MTYYLQLNKNNISRVVEYMKAREGIEVRACRFPEMKWLTRAPRTTKHNERLYEIEKVMTGPAFTISALPKNFNLTTTK